MPGTLFVVATPIGNLEDLTFRARRVLGEVDLIAAEDTRRTSKLLAHYGIERPLSSYREHNEARETPKLVARLQAGTSIALVSDAGTPGIADPGARLVAAAHGAGIPVVPVPGPSAIAALLSVSGIAADEFVFMGFPPASGSVRSRWFERLAGETRPVVCLEAPHRIGRTWRDLQKFMPKARIISGRELTKMNEILVIHQRSVDSAPPDARGEITLVVAPAPSERRQATEIGPDSQDLLVRVYDALAAAGFSRAEALELTAKATGAETRLAKTLIKKRKILVNRQSG